MSRGASLKPCEKMMTEGKDFHPKLIIKVDETIERLKVKLRRWERVQRYANSHLSE